MANYITTHDANGKAIFSNKIPEEQHICKAPGAELRILYTTTEHKPDLSTEADIDQYSHDRTAGLPPGQLCYPNGTLFNIATLKYGHEYPHMHRTMTLDNVVVIQGEVELLLDSGESRVLKAGDSATQRGTMHKWKNVTPNEGDAKIVVFVQPIKEPIEVGGKKLGTAHGGKADS